jgi:putative cell wall-binding protein
MTIAYNGTHLRYFATNAAGTAYSDEVTVTVSEQVTPPASGPRITTSSLPAADYGQSYRATLEKAGYYQGMFVLWSVKSGSLPKGLYLNCLTGVIYGTTKAAVGTYDFTIECYNFLGQSATKDLSITVKATAPTLGSLSVFNQRTVTMGGSGHSYSTANRGEGVKLSLYAPSIKSNGGSAITAQGWQCNVSGSWAAFNPSTTYMSLSYDGKALRYYATNASGTTYSKSILINVDPNSLYPTLGGTNRIGTSELAALDAWPTGSQYAVLANASDYKDALAASYLAGWLNAPVILVSSKTSSNGPAKTALKTLKVSKVYTVGAAITDKVRRSVWKGAYAEVSPNGQDGVTEAVDIVNYVTGTLNEPKPSAVLITTTSGYADAMGASSYAANTNLNMPILYVNGLDGASKAAAEVASLGSVRTVYVLGSTDAVSSAAAAEFTGVSVKRIYGANRQETAAATFATFSPLVAAANADGHLHSVGFVASSGFADALGAGAAEAHLGGVAMITPPTEVGPEVKAVLNGGTFTCGGTTYKTTAIQEYLTNFCFYGKTMSTSVRKTISSYIK